MNENDFSRRDVMPKLRQWGAASRLESATENGIPDILYSMHGFHGLIESKVIHSGRIYFTKFQPAWLTRHWYVTKGDLWVFITDGANVFVFNAEQALRPFRTPMKEWLVASFAEFPVPAAVVPRMGNWEEIHQVLLRHK